MKSTGIVRKVDELGRIVLPIEMRRTLDIAEKDPVEIYVEGDSVILRKYQSSCVFCDSVKDITTFKGRSVCAACIGKLKEL
ncbi:MAG: AbrB/MazE/SpoVT family DNA-binding domain-containing protein [Oscillospiraceae bacterium]|nr:AbrB/MazE/SpoVT family DNA-binding domain-containing protein [Oscillospiraceae bacterium]